MLSNHWRQLSLQITNDDWFTENKWTIERSGKFKKSSEKYLRNVKISKKIQECIDSLSRLREPRRGGERKKGKVEGAYAINISKSVRLLYVVNDTTHTIYLLDIGVHKKVYGND